MPWQVLNWPCSLPGPPIVDVLEILVEPADALAAVAVDHVDVAVGATATSVGLVQSNFCESDDSVSTLPIVYSTLPFRSVL